jgi:hypothetical protein
MKIQTRRLQEESDADGATVAGFSPLDEDAKGNTTPPTRKAAPIGITITKAFAQEAL